MLAAKTSYTVRIGLFLTALSWFAFTFYEFVNGITHVIKPSATEPVWNWLVLQETGGCVGLGLRTAGGLIAVIAALFYLTKRDLSRPEALMALRLIVIFEAAYWLSFLFSISPEGFTGWAMLLENNLPVTFQATILPIVLIILFFQLSPKRASTGGVKWGLIAGVVYILTLWLNNMGNWVVALMIKAADNPADPLWYITQYPANMLSFLLTVAGLLLLAIYTGYITVKTTKKVNPTSLNIRTVGLIITLFGLYFDIIYVMFLSLGAVGGWGMWYAWFTGHNLDLWLMALPLAGVPLLFESTTDTSAQPVSQEHL